MSQNPTISEGLIVPRLNNTGPVPTVISGTLDPIQEGLRAELGSFYVRSTTPPQAYMKIGAGNFDWSLVIGGSQLQVIKFNTQGLTTGVLNSIDVQAPVNIVVGDKLLMKVTASLTELQNNPNTAPIIAPCRQSTIISGEPQCNNSIGPLQAQVRFMVVVIDNPVLGLSQYGFKIFGSGSQKFVYATLTLIIFR